MRGVVEKGCREGVSRGVVKAGCEGEVVKGRGCCEGDWLSEGGGVAREEGLCKREEGGVVQEEEGSSARGRGEEGSCKGGIEVVGCAGGGCARGREGEVVQGRGGGDVKEFCEGGVVNGGVVVKGRVVVKGIRGGSCGGGRGGLRGRGVVVRGGREEGEEGCEGSHWFKQNGWERGRCGLGGERRGLERDSREGKR